MPDKTFCEPPSCCLNGLLNIAFIKSDDLRYLILFSVIWCRQRMKCISATNLAKQMSNRHTGTIETNRFSALLSEGASALFLLLLAGLLLAPEVLGNTLSQVLSLMNP